jgi:putative nucleotidyltransferase with HDIG domain
MKLAPEQLVESLHDLPSPPAVVLDLLGTLEDEDIDISVLAKKVSLDPALTAKTLRLANASAFGLQVKVTTIQQAMTFLGFQTMRNLITTAAVTGCFPTGRCPGFNDRAFWRHASASAVCAQALARRMRFNQDVAFTAGLLHDLGQLVLVCGHPEAYSAVLAWRRQHDCPLIEAERAVLGVDHVDAGVALATHWHFSDVMRQAIARHHAPETPGAGMLAAIVHVADAIVHALDIAGAEDELVPPVSAVAWDAMGLSEEAYGYLFQETERQCEEMSAIMAT